MAFILVSILDFRFKPSDPEVYSSKCTLLKKYASNIPNIQDTVPSVAFTSPPHKNKRLFGFMGNAQAIPYVNTSTVETESVC